MKQFKKTKLATAVGTAAMAMALSTPASAVVLGGDNGWEVSMTGFVNLFYNQGEFDIDESGTSPAVNGLTKDEDTAHLNEGLLPNFLTFKAKSPTVNGLTGTAQFTAAYDSSQAKSTRNNKSGNSLDVREVFFNVEGSFGTISIGRTLGLFQRQAILKDMTLFGVGAFALPDQGGTTLGRIGYGYVYPEFRTRFAYQTPDINGFQLSVGIFDPQEAFPTCTPYSLAYGASCANNAESDVPQFQAEATYNTTFQGGSIGVWAGGLWQEVDVNVGTSGAPIYTSEVESWGWNVGGDIAFSGFNLVGSYYSGEALGVDFKQAGANTFPIGGGHGRAGLFGASGWDCGTTSCTEADNDGFYVQGSYTFNGKTKVGISYGESHQDGEATSAANPVGPSISGGFNDVEHELWTVGVYHDVNSWLKIVAEYNAASQEAECGALFGCTPGVTINGFDFDVFSIGGFMFF